ncbi:MAG: glycosyltransferase [Pseudomonadota bacterium]
MAPPSISVVVNTYNRGTHLEHTLRGLTALTYPAFEVVVVNGPSTDDTAERLERWKERVKLARCAEPNLAMSRNEGIAAAAGDIVAFIDDDAIPHPRWLAALAGAYADPRVAGAGGFTIDHTGARWQVCKTVCDRFGGARHVSRFFDTGPLNRPGSPVYPSLLGTNSSFRRSALLSIGGFDHAFAYLLDETDVCLRLVDAGQRIVYVPEALVFHQFAASHIRNPQRVPKTLYPSARSKAYFVQRHGHRALSARAGPALERYEREIREANAYLAGEGRITAEHRASLDADLGWGIEEGTALARASDARPGGSLGPRPGAPPLLRAAGPDDRLRLAFISRALPPTTDAGIARWTWTMAEGLAARGHEIHLLTEGAERQTTYAAGIWRHAFPAAGGQPAALVERWGLPAGPAAWAAAVVVEMGRLSSFGIDAVSFPIWDLEGIGCLGGPVPTVMSLHTTYALSEPFRADWAMRPVYRHTHVRRMIAAERHVLAEAPVVMANSAAIGRDIEAHYGLSLGERAHLVPHGTVDIGMGSTGARPPKVLFLGRFERRKGFDLAAVAIRHLLGCLPSAQAVFAGDTLEGEAAAMLEDAGCGALAHDRRVRWAGQLTRPALETALREAVVVLFPSRYESFGLVAIEAFAAGTPVVALDGNGPAEIVRDGTDGLVVSSTGGGAALGQALHKLLAEPARAAAMGASARAAFEARFTIDAMCEAAEKVYRAVAASREPREARILPLQARDSAA